MADLSKQLDDIMERVREDFTSKNAARETALPLCREAIRILRTLSAPSIATSSTRRASWRRRRASRYVRPKDSLRDHPDIYNAGFVHDGQKEYAEAAITLAMIEGGDLPTPEQLDVEHAAYLNGMGEAIGELRRHLLDTLRDRRRREVRAVAHGDGRDVLASWSPSTTPTR